MNENARSRQTRRRFLRNTGVTAAGAWMAASDQQAQDVRADSPDKQIARNIHRRIKPNGADAGSVFADIEKLADLHEFEYSFLGDRFTDLGKFKQASREKVFESLIYRPKPVEPRAELSRVAPAASFVLGHVLGSIVVDHVSPKQRPLALSGTLRR